MSKYLEILHKLTEENYKIHSNRWEEKDLWVGYDNEMKSFYFTINDSKFYCNVILDGTVGMSFSSIARFIYMSIEEDEIITEPNSDDKKLFKNKYTVRGKNI